MQKQIYKEVKHKIKNSVPEKDLVKIHVTKNNGKLLYWTKKNKEFRCEGEMYDVVRKESKGDTVTYYCIHDFKESKLFANLDKYVQNRMKQTGRKNIHNFLNLLKNVNIHDEIVSSDNYLLEGNLTFFTYQSNYQPIVLDKIKPPPKHT